MKKIRKKSTRPILILQQYTFHVIEKTDSYIKCLSCPFYYVLEWVLLPEGTTYKVPNGYLVFVLGEILKRHVKSFFFMFLFLQSWNI